MIKTRLIGLLSHAKKYVILQVLYNWLALICQVINIYCVAHLIENAFQGSLTNRLLICYPCVIFACIVMRFFLDRACEHASHKASVDVKRILREKIYEKLLRLGTSYKENVATSEIVQLASEGVEQLETYFGKYLSQFAYSMLAPLTLFIILSFVDTKAAVVLLICVPLIPISIVAVMKIGKRLLNKYWGVYAELGDSFLENLQGLTTLKIYKSDEKAAADMDVEAQHFRRITMKVLTMQLNSTSIMDIMAYGGAAIGMIVTLSELMKGNVSLAGAIMIILLASEFFLPLRLLGSFFHIAMNGMAASDKIFALLDMEEPSQDGLALDVNASAESLDIKFTDVRYSYSEERRMTLEETAKAAKAERKAQKKAKNKSDATTSVTMVDTSKTGNEGNTKIREVLHGISLEAHKGQIIALVGKSGCGKSTIAGILMGRNKNYKGSILINGAELNTISEKSLMENITLVSHNSFIFSGTVAENLRLAKPDATDDELNAVLTRVNLKEELETSQNGLATILLESGSNLSGGQRQRLAMARALLHDTPIYVLDEATSNIDVESEEMIMQVVKELAENRIVILISHRLANVVNADCIYSMEDGNITGFGRHSELMDKNPAYKNLYTQQYALETYGQSENLLEPKATNHTQESTTISEKEVLA